MTEEFSTRETWPMECLRCWHVWQEEYIVRHLTDGHGHDVVVWLRSGAPVQPPWSGVSCPDCGNSRVTAFPPGSRSDRAAASSRSVPRPVAGVAGRGAHLDPEAGAEPGVPAPGRAGAPGERVPADRTVPARWPAGGGRRPPGRGGARPARGRHGQPVLLYALIGIMFLIFTSFELVQQVAIHH
ncbi:hypothetical protein [Streptosporangium sp. NPDC051022]|uniref:hypothetical protein n=1 Tax=Streptosporangium sp. NPDC051022 TaxID=3155752 RepID=UPI003419011A